VTAPTPDGAAALLNGQAFRQPGSCCSPGAIGEAGSGARAAESGRSESRRSSRLASHAPSAPTVGGARPDQADETMKRASDSWALTLQSAATRSSATDEPLQWPATSVATAVRPWHRGAGSNSREGRVVGGCVSGGAAGAICKGGLPDGPRLAVAALLRIGLV
jgi:hypothetical protein